MTVNPYSDILSAQKIYQKSQNHSTSNVIHTTKTDSSFKANLFHQQVNDQFNEFARMSPSEILSHIRNPTTSQQNNQIIENNSSIFSASVKRLKKHTDKAEDVSKKSLIGQASITELLVATKQAENTVSELSKVQTVVIKAFEQIINMSI